MQKVQADVVIIGAGVTGAAIARWLSRYEVTTVLVEKEADVCEGSATKTNAGSVHSGVVEKSHTWKGKMTQRGLELYEEMCTELDVPYQKCGAILAAFTEEEDAHLGEIYRQGKSRGIRDIELATWETIKERDPYFNPEVRRVLYAHGGTGIVCPFRLTIALAENAVDNGVRLLLSQPVNAIHTRQGAVTAVETPDYIIETSYIVNAAGLYADDIARLVGQDDFFIQARKGEWHVVDKILGGLVRRPTYPVPTPETKGVQITPTTSGNILMGPTAVDIEGKGDGSTTLEGLETALEGARRMYPTIPRRRYTINTFSGYRYVAKPANDFVIGPYAGVHGFINAAGIASPGLTAAPGIAEVIVEMLRDEGLQLPVRRDYDPVCRDIPAFRDMNAEERRSRVEDDPAWGQIVCRCEMVTEGEVRAALHRPVPVTTMDGIKRRTRAGMGRCQGGFCSPRVLGLLSRHLGVPATKITKKGGKSHLVLGKTKDLRARSGSRPPG